MARSPRFGLYRNAALFLNAASGINGEEQSVCALTDGLGAVNLAQRILLFINSLFPPMLFLLPFSFSPATFYAPHPNSSVAKSQ